jgi:predicted acyltransferase
VLTGFALDWSGIAPMLKWLASPSFIIATEGICLIILALLYWWIDVRKNQNYMRLIIVVGMNAIFIYLFYNFIGKLWLNGYADTLFSGMLNLIKIPVEIAVLLASVAVFALEWYLCYFLYKKKIFFKL